MQDESVEVYETSILVNALDIKLPKLVDCPELAEPSILELRKGGCLGIGTSQF